jgi:hypothetical protein
MKTSAKLLFILLSVLPLYLVAGNPGEEANTATSNAACAVFVSNNQKVNIIYVPQTKELVHVNIFDKNHNLIFDDHIRSHEGFARTYDFTGLTAGKYTFEIQEKDLVTKKEVEFNTLNKNIRQFASLSMDEQNKKLKLLVTGELQNVKVNIYNADLKLIFTDEVKGSDGFKRTYDLNNMKTKNFYVEVVSGKKIIKQSFI